MFKGLKSLLTGLVTGTALGVLFAPKKGEDTRKDIKEGGLKSVKGTATEMGKDIGDTAKDIYEDLSENEKVQQGVEKAKSLYKEHVPAKHRKEIRKNIKKAKKTVGDVSKKFKKKK